MFVRGWLGVGMSVHTVHSIKAHVYLFAPLALSLVLSNIVGFIHIGSYAAICMCNIPYVELRNNVYTEAILLPNISDGPTPLVISDGLNGHFITFYPYTYP